MNALTPEAMSAMPHNDEDIFETPHADEKLSTRQMIEDTWRRAKRHSEELRRQNVVLDRLQTGMYGSNPNKPGDGIVARVLRLEEAEAKRMKIMWTAIAGAATAVGAAAWNFMTGGKTP